MPIDFATALAAITGAQKASENENPWTTFAGMGDELGGAILRNSGNFDPKETIIASLISGLIGGVGQNLSNTYRDEQNTIANDQMKSILSGGALTRADGQSPSVFHSMQNFDSANKFANQSDNIDANRQFKNQLLGAAAKGMIDNPYRAGKINEVLSGITGGELDYGAPNTPSEVPTITPGASGKSLEDYLNIYQGDEAMARDAMKRDLELPDRVTALRKDFEAKPEIREFVMADTGFKAMMKAFEDPAGTSDVELTRRAIQAIEPGLAVRTDDQNAIAQSPSLPQEWKAQMTGALAGTSKLAPEVREGLMRIAGRSYNEKAIQFNKAKNFYTGEIKKIGGDPSSLTYLEDAAPNNVDSLGLAQTKTVGGVTYKKVPGGWEAQ